MDIKQEIKTMLSTRSGIVWVRSDEEIRTEYFFSDVAKEFSTKENRVLIYKWSISRGLRDENDTCILTMPNSEKPLIDLKATLDKIYEDSMAILRGESKKQRIMYVLEDPFKVFENDFIAVRKLKDIINIIFKLPIEDTKYILVVDTNPAIKMTGVTELEFPLPDEKQLSELIDGLVLTYEQQANNVFLTEEEKKVKKAYATSLKENKELVINSIAGLTLNNAILAIKRSFSLSNKLDIQEIISAKRNFISSAGAIKWQEPDPRGLDGVGGLGELKKWLLIRQKAYTKEAKEYGLPLPKGILVFGPPGSGKSLVATCVATNWNLPLIKLSIGDLFDKYVGETEKNLRSVLAILERVSPCCLLMDEIEKAFSGIGTSGSTDGGTTSRVFGSFLTWLQENKKGTFIIATANDISSLPPEFMRKGRFDELWLVETPSKPEVIEIIEVMKRKYPKAKNVDSTVCASVVNQLTGAEIESAFVTAMNAAFNDPNNTPDKIREPNTNDVVSALKEVTPIINSFKERLERIESFKKIARVANTKVEKEQENKSAGVQDLLGVV